MGLDLGDRQSALCVMDERGQILKECVLPTTKAALRRHFSGGGRARVVMEACGQSHWISGCIEELGHEVLVVNPRRLRLITESVTKTDRNDARLLARLGRLDVELLSPIHRRNDVSVRVRALLTARRNLVEIRTRLVNSVRGTAKVFGHTLRGSSAEKLAAAAMKGLPADVLELVQPQLDTLTALAEQIGRYDAQVEKLGQAEFPQTRLLQQIHGVGPLVALAFVAAIEDPKRFRRSRDVGPYLGLTPRRDQSGGHDPQLGISKHGDSMMRSLLVSAATHIMRERAPDSDLKRHALRVAGGSGPRDRGRARIATARRLAVLMHRLLLTGEVYEPLHAAAQPN
jgi:transposase